MTPDQKYEHGFEANGFRFGKKGGIERRINLETLIITPESFLSDNKTEETKKLSKKWNENEALKNIWLVVACGDARVLIPGSENAISIRSINTGGRKEKKILQDEMVKFAVAMTHMDGSAQVLGKKPRGCGGAAAKEEEVNGNVVEPVFGIKHYIKHKIDHPDAVVQAYVTAERLFNEGGKPTLATIQDHITGEVHFLAAFVKGEKVIRNPKLDWIEESKKDPSKVYNEAEMHKDGLPTISENEIPEIFKDFIEASKVNVKKLKKEYSDLDEIQETQNPRMMVISDKLPSMRTRYAELTKYPNSIFKLHLPREKDENKVRKLDPDAMQEILDQAMYPIGYAVENNKDKSKPFSKLDRIVIETSDIKNSRRMAEEMAKQAWMKEWLALHDHKVILIQNRGGVAEEAEWYEPKMERELVAAT